MDENNEPSAFFQTEILLSDQERVNKIPKSDQNTKKEQCNVSVISNLPKPKKTIDVTSGLNRQEQHERFKPEMASVHMRRTPTPSEGTRKHNPDEPTSDGNLLKLLTMRKIARQVRNVQINRQKRLDYTGNETIEHKVRKFKPDEVEPILYKFLRDNLSFIKYEPQECKNLSEELSEELRDIVKSLKFPRYKFVTMITIGQKDKQTVSIGSQSLWDKSMDTYVSSTYSNDSVFGVAMVFATFFD